MLGGTSFSSTIIAIFANEKAGPEKLPERGSSAYCEQHWDVFRGCGDS